MPVVARAVPHLLVAIGLVLAGAACSGPSDAADAPAVFVTQPGFRPGAAPPPCLEHQTEEPNAAYRGGETSQPVPQLTFLAYYTAAGRSPFCDGAPATPTDRLWGELYARLTNNRAGVSSVLG